MLCATHARLTCRMDDAKLSKLFRDCPAKSIILIEDMWVHSKDSRLTAATASSRAAGAVMPRSSMV